MENKKLIKELEKKYMDLVIELETTNNKIYELDDKKRELKDAIDVITNTLGSLERLQNYK